MMAGRKASKSKLAIKEDKQSSEQNSSPQVAADNLRRELVRKLSSGSSSSLLNNKTDCVDATDKSKENYYDEIVDFEATYENYRDSVISTNTESEDHMNPNGKPNIESVGETSGDIYEEVDTATELNGDIWDKMDKMHRTSYRSTSSSSKRNSLVSISEMPESNSNGEADKKQEMTEGVGTIASLIAEVNKTRSQGTSSSCISPSFNIGEEMQMKSKLIDTDPEKKMEDPSLCNTCEKGQKKKWNPLEKIFNRVFNGSKRKDKGNANAKEICVISGPVDLRNLSDNPTPLTPQLLHDPGKKKGMKKSHSFAVHSRSRRNTDDKLSMSSSSNSSRRESILDELKVKVEQRKSSGSTNADGLLKCVGSIQQERKFLIEQDKGHKDKTSPLLVNDNEAFKEKLARFDKMSKQYSWDDGHSSSCPGRKFGRSTSCRLKTNFILEPPLPPKRKSAPAAVVYDIPQNNRPVESDTNQIIVLDVATRNKNEENSKCKENSKAEDSTSCEINRHSNGNRKQMLLDPKILLSGVHQDSNEVYSNLEGLLPTPSSEENEGHKDESSSCSSLSTPSPICETTLSFSNSAKEFEQKVENKVSPSGSKRSSCDEEAIYSNIDAVDVLSSSNETSNVDENKIILPQPQSSTDVGEKISSSDKNGNEHRLIYENVKFATEETVVQEFETVTSKKN